MITLINAALITLIFSAWVWTLKQEIFNLGHSLQGDSAHHEAAHNQQRGPVHRTDSPLFDQHGKMRNKSGVATWTIA
ncbi:MAG: hypothetical protein HN919_06405 [Verrucomicrobia bacterium]|nr:hypothetical protein [Verrucomicrobiota bacterium]MBT7065914.1 hypothetical protein [Verrucomicrobiota bacterium]MBT7700839.1 hypothetical protein [Verrucomicrobiota bacterium]